MWSKSVLRQGFQIVAHRGYKALICENTVLAFTRALEAGATMLELDVRLSADGQAVLLHDATMQRLANDGRHVANLSWDTLKTMPLYDKRARSHPQGQVMRLKELFGRLSNTCNYCVELKYAPRQSNAYHARLCEISYELIRKHRLDEVCMFVSTDLAILNKLQQIAPHIPIGWVFEFEHQISLPQEVLKLKPILCPRLGLLNDDRVKKFIDRGFSLLPWTANREKQMARLIDWGVIGITTDEVETLVGVCHGRG